MSRPIARLITGYLVCPRNFGDPSSDNKKLFLTENGLPIESKRLYVRITKFANLVDADNKELTVSAIRKAVVTAYGQDATEKEKRELCTLFGHRYETQARFYNISKRQLEAVRAAMKLEDMAATSQSSKTYTHTSTESKRKSKEEDQPVAKSAKASSSSSTCTSKEMCEEAATYNPSREKWSDHDTKVIKLTMKRLLNASVMPKRNEIREAWIEKLPRIWNRKLGLVWQSRCIEKVRSLYRQKER